jgi:hypothetical protein
MQMQGHIRAWPRFHVRFLMLRHTFLKLASPAGTSLAAGSLMGGFSSLRSLPVYKEQK